MRLLLPARLEKAGSTYPKPPDKAGVGQSVESNRLLSGLWRLVGVGRSVEWGRIESGVSVEGRSGGRGCKTPFAVHAAHPDLADDDDDDKIEYRP